MSEKNSSGKRILENVIGTSAAGVVINVLATKPAQAATTAAVGGVCGVTAGASCCFFIAGAPILAPMALGMGAAGLLVGAVVGVSRWNRKKKK